MPNSSAHFIASYAGMPAASLFAMPSNIALPPAPANAFLSSWYPYVMDIRTPLVIASAYAALVHAANRYRRHNPQPLAFTKTRLFRALVLAHNTGLCAYSAWTCAGIVAATHRSLLAVSSAAISPLSAPARRPDAFWPALCDLSDGIWEHGLAFYGYYFYLSKFYEVLDTAIILAKGRQSSTLQTYHHAGAMLSMWIGLRFASPPIWTFVVFNSLIHTIMYFYYTLSALRVRVPKILKRALTTAQISQFLIGGSFALSTLFRYYLKPSTGTYCSCLENPGQVLALLFNVFYLAPLTYLFVKFWIDSYIKGWRAQEKGVEKGVEKGDSKGDSRGSSSALDQPISSRLRKV